MTSGELLQHAVSPCTNTDSCRFIRLEKITFNDLIYERSKGKVEVILRHEHGTKETFLGEADERLKTLSISCDTYVVVILSLC